MFNRIMTKCKLRIIALIKKERNETEKEKYTNNHNKKNGKIGGKINSGEEEEEEYQQRCDIRLDFLLKTHSDVSPS